MKSLRNNKKAMGNVMFVFLMTFFILFNIFMWSPIFDSEPEVCSVRGRIVDIERVGYWMGSETEVYFKSGFVLSIDEESEDAYSTLIDFVNTTVDLEYLKDGRNIELVSVEIVNYDGD